jgi:mono/diheme cytochrome c family protein
MTGGSRFSWRGGARSTRAMRAAKTALVWVLALLVAACASRPTSADGAAAATSAAIATPPAGAVPSTPSGATPAAVAASPSGAAALGEQTYRETCVVCHGADGKGGQGGGMPLTAVPTADFVIETVNYGRNNMPAFTGVLTTEQIRAVSDYVLTLTKH